MVFTNTLFETVAESLRELLGDEKYLGGRVGLLCALHTWNQSLDDHVHSHCLVTAGGLVGGQGTGESARWIEAKKSCLRPRHVLMLKSRGKFKAKLRQRLQQGELRLPPSMSLSQFNRLMWQVSQVPWNVKILDRYALHRGRFPFAPG